MINRLKIKYGNNTKINEVEIPINAVTIFVGPNNSGKSKILKEIDGFCRNGLKNTQNLLIEEIGLDAFEEKDALKEITKNTFKPKPADVALPDHIFFGDAAHRTQIRKDSLLKWLTEKNGNSSNFCQYYLRYKTLLLNGQTRLGLIEDQEAGNLQAIPVSSLQVLLKSDDLREKVRSIIFEALGNYFVIDPTNLGKLRIRMSSRLPNPISEERGIGDDAVRFHSEAIHINECSDGVKAFIGIISEIYAGDPRVLLIDEPEAFLHPPLAFKLGRELSRAAAESNKRIFASTHSANFIMGCIHSGVDINIVRLTHRNGESTARILPKLELVALMRNPLLRSVGVLSGLFYECVIVVEGDTDRAFYQEINERMLSSNSGRGIQNCLFLNAQNKQTIHQIIKPLRKLGIPAIGIVDIDIIKEGGSVWTNFLSCGNIPEIEHQPLGQQRAKINEKFDKCGIDMGKVGLKGLQPADAEGANTLFDRLSKNGLFVVRNGELETWLSTYQDCSKKSEWLVSMFEKLGDDPSSISYVHPTTGDVWDFIASINEWYKSKDRKGV